MKEYQYSIIRRESRNPKRNREGRGISQSDLEALKQELDGNSRGIVSAIYDRDIALDSLAVTSGDISERLKTAEEALTGKLDSGDFSKWRTGELAEALASKQPKGSYVDPSQLATSQQQAVDEAVRQAGEMDKQLKVGGRNLFRKEYFIGDLASRYKIPFDALQPRDGDNTYTLSLDYKISPEDKASSPRITCMYTNGDNRVFLWDSDIKRDGEWHHKEYTIKLDIDPSKYPIYGWFTDYGSNNGRTIDMVAVRNIKLERGTIATDWTPAPEDVEESVSKVSKSFEDLSTHPLTVDDNGFWKIWSVKDNKYVTTQYQSRGRDGQDGRNGSDGADGKDGHTPRIDWDGTKLIIENMAPVDLRGEAGHSPELHVGEDDYLYVDGVKQRYLRGQRGEDGHSPSPEDVLKTERFKQLLGGEVTTQITPLEGDLELTKRAVTDAQDGVTHTLEELDKAKLSIYSGMEDLKIQTDGVASDLNTAKTDIGTALNRADDATRAATDAGNQVRDFDGKLTDTNKKLTTATNNIADLSSRSLTHKQKEDLTDITDSLQVLRSGDNNTLEGLALQRIIALSGDGANVSAYIASKPMDTAFKAGIVDFGKPTEREQVEITHQGTGHIGNLYFEGNQIDFRTGRDDDPYLSIGAEESQFIGQFISTARLDDTPVSVSSVTLTTSTTSYERTADVANDGTRLTVTIDSIKIETYGGAKTRLTLDGEVLAEWRGKEYKNHGGSLTGGDIEITQEPYTASDLYYERGVKAGRHTIRLDITNPTDGATATVKGLRVRRRYDTGRQQSVLTKSGLRLFGSPDRYLDVDYRTTYRVELGNGRFYYYPNDYLVRIKGGAKVDKLTADELDMPGVPLCGATFDEFGSCINSFGARAKQNGGSIVQAYRAYNADFYRVYHSIGHKNYIPVLQVYGLSNGNYTQCLTTRIDAIEADSFAVRIVTTGNVSVKHSFSYVAFKTTE